MEFTINQCQDLAVHKIIVFFIYQNPFIIKLTVERPYFISFVSLYPLRGIEGSYFNEEVNFYEQEAASVIKRFLFTNLLPYHSLNRHKVNLQNEMMMLFFDEAEVKSRVEIFKEFDIKCFSKNAFKDLKKTVAQYIQFKTLSFENIEDGHSEVRNMEIMAETILKGQVNDVLFINYEDNKYTGERCSSILQLSSVSLPQEYLLQELRKFRESAPHIDGDYYESYWKRIFQERFESFSEQKKLSIFQLSKSENPLYIYNHALSDWWVNRY
ncbi:hypothetical protein [Chryseobacterium sp. R2A-55]|uniref:hypothetical protein n=1 Tax=Chryseobacterium sp. R2A-55 TaxID=2744445 RepID=UPI001F3CEC15|nr:hypothetical protein [Chryseobacterium sp. R2A-55]